MVVAHGGPVSDSLERVGLWQPKLGERLVALMAPTTATLCYALVVFSFFRCVIVAAAAAAAVDTAVL